MDDNSKREKQEEAATLTTGLAMPLLLKLLMTKYDQITSKSLISRQTGEEIRVQFITTYNHPKVLEPHPPNLPQLLFASICHSFLHNFSSPNLLSRFYHFSIIFQSSPTPDGHLQRPFIHFQPLITSLRSIKFVLLTIRRTVRDEIFFVSSCPNETQLRLVRWNGIMSFFRFASLWHSIRFPASPNVLHSTLAFPVAHKKKDWKKREADAGTKSTASVGSFLTAPTGSSRLMASARLAFRPGSLVEIPGRWREFKWWTPNVIGS